MRIPADVIRQSSLIHSYQEPINDIVLSDFCPELLKHLCADDQKGQDETAWTYEVIGYAIQHHPDLAYAIILGALRLCETPSAVAVVAAGPMEDLLILHGSDLIERVEADAKQAPRIRFLLSGVWKSEISEGVWTRISALRKIGPVLDAGDPLPSN